MTRLDEIHKLAMDAMDAMDPVIYEKDWGQDTASASFLTLQNILANIYKLSSNANNHIIVNGKCGNCWIDDKHLLDSTMCNNPWKHRYCQKCKGQKIGPPYMHTGLICGCKNE